MKYSCAYKERNELTKSQTWSQGHHMQGQGQGLDLQGQGQGLYLQGQGQDVLVAIFDSRPKQSNVRLLCEAKAKAKDLASEAKAKATQGHH